MRLSAFGRDGLRGVSAEQKASEHLGRPRAAALPERGLTAAGSIAVCAASQALAAPRADYAH